MYSEVECYFKPLKNDAVKEEGTENVEGSKSMEYGRRQVNPHWSRNGSIFMFQWSNRLNQ